PTDSPETTDRIEKRFELDAPRSRVWRAIADSTEFGTWFRMQLDQPFEAGKTVIGRMTAASYEHLGVEMRIEKVDPESHFAYRWHPYALDPNSDFSAEPMTLVEFQLEDAGNGTVVTITESGFDA